MWWTQTGMRTLEGAEARLFRNGLSDLYYLLLDCEQEGGQLETGKRIFDDLTFDQKYAMLDLVGRGLLRRTIRVKILTAVLESTVAAVFEQLKENVFVEVTELNTVSQRNRVMIIEASKEQSLTGAPAKHSKKLDGWYFQLDRLRDQILWDLDYELEEDWIDLPPHAVQKLKGDFGIDDDYFTTVAPDPKPSELKRIHSRLRRMCDETD